MLENEHAVEDETITITISSSHGKGEISYRFTNVVVAREDYDKSIMLGINHSFLFALRKYVKERFKGNEDKQKYFLTEFIEKYCK